MAFGADFNQVEKLRPVELGFDLNEALKKTGFTKDDLNCLRQPPINGVPEAITDKQLILFLNACDDVKSARAVLKLYYDIRNSTPELFNNRNIDKPDIQQCLAAQEYFQLPNSPEGHLVMCHRLYNPLPAEYNFKNAVQVFFMTIDACLYTYGAGSGLVFVFDMTGVSLGHLSRLRIGIMRKFFQYLQEALPIKLRAIHVLNVVPFFDKILTLIKPFMKKEILAMLHLHKVNEMEEFYKIIPKSGLPSDFGGTLQNSQKLQKLFWSDVNYLQKYFEAEEEQRKGVASKVEEKTSSEQSFNRLEID